MSVDRLSIQLSLLRNSRHNSVLLLFPSLEREMAKILQKIKEAEDVGDSNWYVEQQLEHIEEFLGVAFVCAQVFITGVRSRFEALFKASGGKIPFPKVLQLGPKLDGFDFTAVEAINKVANYWKHHKQWPTHLVNRGDFSLLTWNKDDKKIHKRTAEIVEKLGMMPSSSGNLRTAAEQFCGSDKLRLSAIENALFKWIEAVYKIAEDRVAETRFVRGS